MDQNEIRDYNGNEFSIAEGAALIKELNDRTKSDQVGYNSVDELATKVQEIVNTQEMLIHTPRIAATLSDDQFRGVSEVSGYGSDAVNNRSLSSILTWSLLPIAGLIKSDNLKLKYVDIHWSLLNYGANYYIVIYAKELDTDSTGTSNPVPISVTELAKIPMSDLGNRGYLKRIIINSEILLKKLMTIEIYVTGSSGNTAAVDFRAPMYNLRFEK